MPEADEHQSAERQSLLELTRSIAGLPLDQAAAVLETSAAVAAISLRAGIEFFARRSDRSAGATTLGDAFVGRDGPASRDV